MDQGYDTEKKGRYLVYQSVATQLSFDYILQVLETGTIFQTKYVVFFAAKLVWEFTGDTLYKVYGVP